MPNWCSNTMTIATKDKESLERILGRIGSKESPIDFEKIVPQEIFSPEYQFSGDHMNGDLDEESPVRLVQVADRQLGHEVERLLRLGVAGRRFLREVRVRYRMEPGHARIQEACRDVPRSVHLRRIRRGGHGLPRRVGTGRGRKLLRRLLRGFAGGIRPEVSWILVYFRNRRKKYDFFRFPCTI